MTKWSKDKASRLREFRDCDDEYRETRSKKAAARRAIAMRKHSLRDFQRANEIIMTRVRERQDREMQLIRRFGIELKRGSLEALRRRSNG